MNRFDSNPPLPLYGNFGAGGKKAPAFPLSPYMVVASVCFWLFIAAFTFKGCEYFLLYKFIDDSDLEVTNCCEHLGSDPIENEKFVQNYPKGDAGPYLMRLGPERYSSNFVGTESPRELSNIPTLVTAVTSSDFWDVQGLLKQFNHRLKKLFPDAKMIVYDIGLYQSETELLKKYGFVEVRSFQTSQYPSHVGDISNYAWRPIIIQSILEEFGSVIWISPQSRIAHATDLKQLKYRGDRHFFAWQTKEYIATIAYTNPKTFTYLNESRCCFLESGLVDMSMLVFYRTNFTWNAIMKPWLKCTLNKDCLIPPKARYSGCFHMRKPKTTGCHRYDQSVLSIILDRVFLFTFKLEKYVIPRIATESEENEEHFPEQPWTWTELAFLVLMPSACLGGLYYIYQRQRGKKRAYRRR
ncbi:hypothetical protein CHS0354_012351 [Potamilus streckersoni]|uniref:Uncharacterized protein n=1 Tax=Potamilus streckersoni TaxID=2493646 RepID=A0AAE0SKL7_9BIVA|nr:hypothetical protein CHS0354_012351 [Potamilus streckersoni]